MASERKGIVARWLEGKERDEEYARNSLPTNRWSLFWDILKGRFGKLVIINLLMLVTTLPLLAVIVLRYLLIYSEGALGAYASGLGWGLQSIPPFQMDGVAEATVLQFDLIFYLGILVGGVIAGLGISGGAYIIRNLIWTEGVFVANDFWRGVKRNFWNVLEAVLIFCIVLYIARAMANLADYYVALGLPHKGWMIASKVVGYVFVVLMLLVCMWMISLGINYKQGPWQLFRNAVVLTVGTFPQTVFFAALALAPILLMFIGGRFLLAIGVLLLIFLSLSYCFLVWMDYSQWAFDKFINPNHGIAVGRGLYNKEKGGVERGETATDDNEAMREYRRMIVAAGKSALVSRPIKPIDDDVEIYQLPASFSREDLKKLRESKEFMAEDVKAYETEHKDDPQYVEYNREFEERERALQEEEAGNDKKKKPPKKPPKMLNKKK